MARKVHLTIDETELTRNVPNIDNRLIAEKIAEDVDGYLFDAEDWTRRDTVERRLSAVWVMLLSFIENVSGTLASYRKGQMPPGKLEDILFDLVFAAQKPLWILEYGIPPEAFSAALPKGPVDDEGFRAAVMFAEMRRVQARRRPWHWSAKFTPEEGERLAQLHYLCIATNTTLETFLRQIRSGSIEAGKSDPENESTAEAIDQMKVDDDQFAKFMEERKDADLRVKELKTELEQLKKDNRDRRSEIVTVKRKLTYARNRYRQLKRILKEYEVPATGSIEDPRTIGAFLKGKRIKQTKLDAMRQFFLDRIEQQEHKKWLRPYVEAFFPASVVRGGRVEAVVSRPAVATRIVCGD